MKLLKMPPRATVDERFKATARILLDLDKRLRAIERALTKAGRLLVRPKARRP